MANRLADETSPYLQQHAHNPVDWYPWGSEALERARAEDRPILLSVGYSACHWCHVMERESFEHEGTAALMNKSFVNVKVDREERPDLDEIYMKAVQAFTGGHGGWPMTVFLTPEGKPFLGGTYFPPEPRHGMPSFGQLMEHALRAFRERRDAVEQTAGRVLEGIRPWSSLPKEAPELGTDWLEAIAQAAFEDYDPDNGGFGHSPKFPPHTTLAVLLAHHHDAGSSRSLEMVAGTLDGMARGGTWDLLGGGFARYSVDEKWLIPHFEKMLYDNAQLAPLYADAWRVTGEARFARIARETLDWMLREMSDPAGGFHSALDADSEGEEGRFYAWTPAAIEEVTGEDGARLCELLQVSDGGTFEHGTSVLRLELPLEALPVADRALFETARGALLSKREERVRPGLDDKVIACWNGLAISALARVGAALDEPRYVAAAARAADFVLGDMSPDGRLHRTWKAGRVGAPGFLDDYAAVTLSLIDLWEATFEARWLRAALALAERTLELFWDEDDGGFFYTGHDAEKLVARSKHLVGGAVPSGNGMMALALTRLHALAERPDFADRADRVLRSYRALLDGAPRALGPEALAAMWRARGGQEIAIVGDGGEALLREVRRRFLPFAVLGAGAEATADLLPWMAGRDGGDAARALLCEGRSCQAPTSDPAELGRQLDDLGGALAV